MRTIPIDAVIGGVMNKPADLVEPGRIRLADQPTDRLAIGELDNRITPRLAAIKAAIEPAGWPVIVSEDIRAVNWRKLMSNGVFNPLAALTQSTHRQIGDYEPTRRIRNGAASCSSEPTKSGTVATSPDATWLKPSASANAGK